MDNKELQDLITKLDQAIADASPTQKQKLQKLAESLNEMAEESSKNDALKNEVVAHHQTTKSGLEKIHQAIGSLEFPEPKDFPQEFRVNNLHEIPTPKFVFPKEYSVASIKNTLDQIAQALKDLKEGEDEEEEEEEDLAIRADETDQNTIYFGEAQAGSSNDEPVWKIKRITTQGGNLRTEYPDGESTFSFAWSKRVKLNYT